MSDYFCSIRSHDFNGHQEGGKRKSTVYACRRERGWTDHKLLAKPPVWPSAPPHRRDQRHMFLLKQGRRKRSSVQAVRETLAGLPSGKGKSLGEEGMIALFRKTFCLCTQEALPAHFDLCQTLLQGIQKQSEKQWASPKQKTPFNYFKNPISL